MVAEMRMFQWMCGYTKLDKIRNVVIREKVSVAPIEDKMKETQLRWFGHVKMCINAPVRRCETINFMHYKKWRGRPKTSWNEIFRGDLKFIGLAEDMEQDRSQWRSGIKIGEYR